MRLESALKSSVSALLGAFNSGRSGSLPSPDQIRKILVVRQHNQLGDMLCIVPLLKALQQRFPLAEITLLASPVNIEVMENCRYTERVLNYDKQEFLNRGSLRPGRYLDFVRQLRAERFDLALVPMTVSISFTSCLLAFLSGARIRIGADTLDGKANTAGAFFNMPVSLDWRTDPHRHQTLRNCDTARELIAPPDDLSCVIFLKDEETRKGEMFVKASGSGPAVAMHPGAGKVPNRWPVDRFARVADALVRQCATRIFVTEGPMDEEPVGEMISLMSATPIVIRDKPIREVAAILAKMDLIITNDTGIMHVGAAVGTPVLSLFGPTDGAQWAPVGSLHSSIQSLTGQIESIQESEVLKRALEMLGKSGLANGSAQV